MAVAYFLAYWDKLLVLALMAVLGATLLAVTDLRHLARRLGTVVYYVVTLVPIPIVLLEARTGQTEAAPAGQLGQIVKYTVFAVIGLGVFLLIVQMGSRTPLRPAHLALILYSLLGLLSAWTNDQPVPKTLLYLPSAVLSVAVGCNWDFNSAVRHGKAVLRIYIWGTFALLLIAHDKAIWTGQNREWFHLPQVAGLTPHPNGLGTIAVMAFFLEFINPDEARRRRAPTATSIAALVALALSQSRGSILALFVGLLVLFVSRRRTTLRWITLGSPLALVLAGLLPPAVNVLHRFADDPAALSGRQVIWAHALDVWRSNPLLGGGDLGTQVAAYGTPDPGNAHDQFIQALAERGLVGLLVLLVFIWSLLRGASSHPLTTRGPLLALAGTLVVRFLPESPLINLPGGLEAMVALVIVAVLGAPAPRPRALGSEALQSGDRRWETVQTPAVPRPNGMSFPLPPAETRTQSSSSAASARNSTVLTTRLG